MIHRNLQGVLWFDFLFWCNHFFNWMFSFLYVLFYAHILNSEIVFVLIDVFEVAYSFGLRWN